MEAGSAGGGVQSVLTALNLLERISESEAMGVTDIAKRLGMPKSSTQRYLTTLGSAGWLSVSNDGPPRWSLGPNAIGLGLRAVGRLSLRDVTRPILEELRDLTGESALLSIPTSRGALVLDRVEGVHSIRSVIGLGEYLPYHASAAGLVLLSTFTEQRIRSILTDIPTAFTTHTVTDVESLFEQLNEIRDRNFAINQEYLSDGVSGFGSSVLDSGGRAIAAISASIPTVRFVKETVFEQARILAERVRSVQGLLSAS